MAVIQSGLSTDLATVDPSAKGLYVSAVQRGRNYRLSVNCGTQAAALLASGAFVFAMRYNPSATTRAYFTQITLTTIVITAFTTAAGSRALGIQRANGAVHTGGTQLIAPIPGRLTIAASDFSAASGGDIRFTNAIAGLGGGPTYPAITAGAVYDARHIIGNGALAAKEVTELLRSDVEPNPIVMNAGDVMTVRNVTQASTGETGAAAAFDAAGVVALIVDLSWFEAPLVF